jgi:hypothetical protein
MKYNLGSFGGKIFNYPLTQLIVITSGFIAPHYGYAQGCHIPATMCEVQKAISEALSPVPPQATPAVVSLGVQSLSSIAPTGGSGAQKYVYKVTNTIIGTASNISSALSITCTAFPQYMIYNGAIQAASSAIAATFTTTTPGTTCPEGTLSCGSNPTTTISLPATGLFTTTTDTNYTTAFTSTNTGWFAYVTGYYQCTYTDPNVLTTVNIVVPWGGGGA